jgi:hypothetical protein
MQDEEPGILCSTPNSTTENKYRRTQLAKNVARIVTMRNAHKIFVKEIEGKRLLCRTTLLKK